ncbi:MAG: adenylate/guanylate cyclase domain-containing protein [Verrucomicrobiae bacterium]|nr:adenylate/guanylate cyclase domain-containing protein [Verrucomicrobiae bacterium]
MFWRWLKPVPLLTTLSIVVVVTVLRLLVHSPLFPNWRFLMSIEEDAFDWRMRGLYRSQPPVASNLAAVFIDDETLKILNERYGFSWPLPRQLYGRLVRELTAQGAKVIGFDILFDSAHPRHPSTDVKLPDGRVVGSDEFFAEALQAAGPRVILAVMGETRLEPDTGQVIWQPLLPNPRFTNGVRLAHIMSEADPDGITRRAVAFHEDTSPARSGRYWMLGLMMAATELGMDLSQAEVAPGRITLRPAAGAPRALQVDDRRRFLVNWSMTWNDPRLTKVSLEEVLDMDAARQAGQPVTNAVFKDKLVVVGSIGTGNNLSDIGATPLSKETFLVSKHWNLASQLITHRLLREAPLGVEIALIVVMSFAGFILTWVARPWLATAAVIATLAAYLALSYVVFVRGLYVLPVATPLLGALLSCHFAAMAYRVVFEQKEQRRIKGIFSKVVAPSIVNELLESEHLALGGAQRRVTVYFADVRGFTQYTDEVQRQAQEYVRQQGLSGQAATDYMDARAEELLATVNLYLSTVAGIIKEHGGTLDKYMGDCVMAFWGAPQPNPRHAASCVRAAIAAQSAIHRLNQERGRENERRLQENVRRAAAKLPPLPLLPLLKLGSGINTGTVTVGLMGSEEHLFNYTVFGREVNLASRLEGISGHGKIIIGAGTYEDLKRDDPPLAALCIPLSPVQVKGFQEPVVIYEVRWKPEEAPSKAAA